MPESWLPGCLFPLWRLHISQYLAVIYESAVGICSQSQTSLTADEEGLETRPYKIDTSGSSPDDLAKWRDLWQAVRYLA